MYITGQLNYVSACSGSRIIRMLYWRVLGVNLTVLRARSIQSTHSAQSPKFDCHSSTCNKRWSNALCTQLRIRFQPCPTCTATVWLTQWKSYGLQKLKLAQSRKSIWRYHRQLIPAQVSATNPNIYSEQYYESEHTILDKKVLGVPSINISWSLLSWSAQMTRSASRLSTYKVVTLVGIPVGIDVSPWLPQL